jgi:hypothetical protein
MFPAPIFYCLHCGFMCYRFISMECLLCGMDFLKYDPLYINDVCMKRNLLDVDSTHKNITTRLRNRELKIQCCILFRD